MVGTPVAYHNSDYGCRVPGSVIGPDPLDTHLPPDLYPIPSVLYVLGGQLSPSGQLWSPPPLPSTALGLSQACWPQLVI